MEELKFKILNIGIERRLNGQARIRAICLNDDAVIEIETPQDKLTDREHIKDILGKEYRYQKELKTRPIQLGDIL